VFRNLDGQSHPLFVGEPNPPPFKLILEHTILFYKRVDVRLFCGG
jgi:hypothetical protein